MGRRRFTLRKGHRVLITGGASGLGRAFAEAATARGARVVLADIQPMDEVMAALGPAEAHGVPCDVSNPEEVEQMVVEATTRLGGLDLVFNNAGVAAAGPLDGSSLADWEWLRRVDLDGVLYVARAVIPALRQSQGWLVNTASLAAFAQAPHMTFYNVCKAGVVALSETLYGELLADGIGVSVVCPGFFRTGLTSTFRYSHPGQKAFVEKVMEKSRLSARDVAELTLAEIARGRLYVVPPGLARFTWRLSRFAPQLTRERLAARFHRSIRRATERRERASKI